MVQRNFNEWVSSYYDHPKDPESVSDLHFGQRTESATSDTWRAEDLKVFHDYDAFMKSDMAMWVCAIQFICQLELMDVLGCNPLCSQSYESYPIES